MLSRHGRSRRTPDARRDRACQAIRQWLKHLTPETIPWIQNPTLTSNLNVNMNQTLIKLQELVDAQNQASGATYLDSLSLSDALPAVYRHLRTGAEIEGLSWSECIQFVGQQGDLDIQTLRFCAEACGS